MEIELKYLLNSPGDIESIFEDKDVATISDKESRITIPMKAIYYDTEDGALTDSNIAFRIRSEGEYTVATVKYKNESVDGLHRRQEINVPLDKVVDSPDWKIFSDSPVGDDLEQKICGNKLKPLLIMEFKRQQVRLDTGKSISVLSTDSGVIKAGEKEIPILECELELYSGDEGDMVDFGMKLASRHGLVAENKTKFERGIALLTSQRKV